MSITLKRTPRRRPTPWWWLGAYVVVIVLHLPVALLLMRQGQDPAIALGVPAAVSGIAITVLTRLGGLAGLDVAASPVGTTSAGAVRRPRV